MRLKSLLFVFVALVISGQWSVASGQTVQDPTVTAAIHQKYDHTPTYPGFDTVVSPSNPTIVLTSNTNAPVQRFNGMYTVEQIPFSPVDTNFGCSADSVITAANRTTMNLSIFNLQLSTLNFQLSIKD